MAYYALGADEETDSDVLRRVDSNVTQIMADRVAEQHRRNVTLALTIAGAVFAAAKLGFIAIPHIKRWRADR